MRSQILRSIITLLCISSVYLIYPALSHASSLTIANAERVAKDEDTDTMTIEFDIAWDNSWKDSVNNDAAWVFLKYRTGTSGYAEHATLYQSGINPTAFDRGTGTAVDLIVPDDKLGLFIQREHIGTGSLDTNDIEIVWDYGADGVSDANAELHNIYIMAVEMVYVVEGGFYAGDGDSVVYAKASDAFQFRDRLPGHVSSEGAIQFQGDTDQDTAWWYDSTTDSSDDYSDGANFTLSESFPKGFQAFYIMKNEISQKQYSSFLNLLDWPRQKNLQATALTSAASGKYVMTNSATMSRRDTIRLSSTFAGGSTVGPGTFYHDYGTGGNLTSGNSTFNATSDGEWIAMNYMKWTDFCALADWMGLRPMTEFEFEKAARGPIYPVLYEFAWGDSSYVADDVTFGGTGYSTEVGSDAGGSRYAHGTGGAHPHTGPRRSGSRTIGLSAPYTRDKASSGYWGVFDLSGNVGEMCVSVGVEESLGFSGTHGDGELSSSGYADNSDWPGYVDGEVTGATGSGWRAQFPMSGMEHFRLHVSDRENAANSITSRLSHIGGRFVRTAPGAGEQLDYQ